MKQATKWIIIVLAVLGFAAQNSNAQIPSIKDFKMGRNKIAHHFKTLKNGDLAFKISPLEFKECKDTLLKLSARIVDAKSLWDQGFKTGDATKASQAYDNMMAARSEFRDVLWVRIFKFTDNMHKLNLSHTGLRPKYIAKLKHEYSEFIWCFNTYCSERVPLQYPLRPMVVGKKPGLQF